MNNKYLEMISKEMKIMEKFVEPIKHLLESIKELNYGKYSFIYNH